MGREQLTLALLACYMSWSAGLWFVKKTFKGGIRPIDPDVCVTENIMFTSVLLEDPRQTFSIGFAMKNRRTNGKYVAVESNRITKINETMSQFTVFNLTLEPERATKAEYFYVSSYYWQDFGDTTGKLQLGDTTSPRIYPLPEKVQDFKCIVINYESMRCTWNYGKDYGENMPEVIFQWRIPSFSGSWNDCSDLNIENRYCFWDNLTAGYFKSSNITVRLTLRQPCGINDTSELPIDIAIIVKPNPVSSLSSTAINSTCIKIFWDTSDSEPQHPKEHRIIVSSKEVNLMDMRFITTSDTEIFPKNRTICNLHPYTEYTFSVSIKPTGLYSGYFSDQRHSVSKTYPDIPSASPDVTEGGYKSNRRDCGGTSKQRNVCIFWKAIDAEHENGPMKGLEGEFTAIHTEGHSVQVPWAEDMTYGCYELLCNTSYIFTIKARNVNGTSQSGPTLTIPTSILAIKSPQFIVESANKSEVYISWDHQKTPSAKEFLVAWCRNKNGDCEPHHEVYWNRFPSDIKEAVLRITASPQDFLYGVIVLTEEGSSGVEWQDCVYLKYIAPKREPQNVVVSLGSEDNTLVVTWDKLSCRADEPYIAAYNLQYKNAGDRYQKSVNVTQSGEARVVLQGLEDDQTYVVTVRGVTRDGQYGPESQPHSSKQNSLAVFAFLLPLERCLSFQRSFHFCEISLKQEEIAGISTAVLVGVMFAGVGCVCAVRRCKQKAQKAIKEARNITIHPPSHSLDVYTHCKRQNSSDSNDSGFDLTPPPYESAEGKKLSSPQNALPYDYRLATTDKDEQEVVTLL